MDEKLPETLEELCDWILTHADSIIVKQKNGPALPLSQVPAQTALENALRWIKEGTIPHRTREEVKGDHAHQS